MIKVKIETESGVEVVWFESDSAIHRYVDTLRVRRKTADGKFNKPDTFVEWMYVKNKPAVNDDDAKLTVTAPSGTVLYKASSVRELTNIIMDTGLHYIAKEFYGMVQSMISNDVKSFSTLNGLTVNNNI